MSTIETTRPGTTRDIAIGAGLGFVLTAGWLVQYTLWVPLVLIGRAGLACAKIGLIGILLLCLPVIGWVILLLWLLLRKPPAPQMYYHPTHGWQPVPLPSKPRGPSVFRPWGIDILRRYFR